MPMAKRLCSISNSFCGGDKDGFDVLVSTCFELTLEAILDVVADSFGLHGRLVHLSFERGRKPADTTLVACMCANHGERKVFECVEIDGVILRLYGSEG